MVTRFFSIYTAFRLLAQQASKSLCQLIIPTALLKTQVIMSRYMILKRAFSAGMGGNKVAVILSGSGVYDGSEIHEASATLVHLTRLNYQPVCYAPDKPQMHTINHAKGEESKESRNVLTESARIARGNIQQISALNPKDVAAAIFPGGFGAAKNLSDFAVNGPNLTVDQEIAKLVTELIKEKRPLGFMCIAPILAAKLIPGVQVTLGQDKGDKWPHAGAIEAATKLGAKIQLCNVNQTCVDKNNRVVSTPAFMFDGQFHEIFDGIGLLVKEIDNLVKGN